ncbi:MAG: 2,3-bisphosphoglycerate-dependent phosphoglycerate mutase [Candidatus Marinimicrobia bacterium]|nr:2,3-bisphosphoglycerate-dependent phosphoglycerate mutase [Candidatus Neomarinimicrobiota bacterium]
MSMAKLVLVRHGQSEWNKRNLFTGWKDPDLTEKGAQEARDAGKLLKKKGIKFNIAFTSNLIRAQNTLTIILKELDQNNIKNERNVALNERNYGELAGLNKDDARKKWGDEQVQQWRRSYHTPPPGGESLKDTADRVLPYFKKNITSKIKEGSSILIVAHGNSLRALVMYIESIKPEDIVSLEIKTGVPLIYNSANINNIERIY